MDVGLVLMVLDVYSGNEVMLVWSAGKSRV